MGNCTSTLAKAQKHISNKIDQQFKSPNFKKEYKVLLLGPDDCGISTKMELHHRNGYTSEELAKFKHAVYANLVDSAKDIVKAMSKLGLKPLEPDNVVRILYLT